MLLWDANKRLFWTFFSRTFFFSLRFSVQLWCKLSRKRSQNKRNIVVWELKRVTNANFLFILSFHIVRWMKTRKCETKRQVEKFHEQRSSFEVFLFISSSSSLPREIQSQWIVKWIKSFRIFYVKVKIDEKAKQQQKELKFRLLENNIKEDWLARAWLKRVLKPWQ